MEPVAELASQLKPTTATRGPRMSGAGGVRDAIYGPDIVSNNVTSTTRVPSAIVVALFAYLATRVVARYGFGPAR